MAFAAIALAIFAARPAATPGPALRDFEAYWSAGATWNDGADPYGRAIWNHERAVPGVDGNRDELLPFVGPPAALLVWSLAARLPYERSAALWTAVLGLAVAALAVAALRGSRAPLSLRFILAALALAVGFGPLTSDVALGQLALPAFAAAAWVAAGLPAWLTAAAACVALTQPNASAGLVALLGRNRTTVAVLIGVALTYLLGTIVAGPSWPVLYARILAPHAAAERWSAIQITPAAIAYGFGASPLVATVAGIAAASGAVAAAVFFLRRIPDRFGRFASFSALVPFVAGFVHEHDLVVTYAAAAWCGARTRGATRVVALTGTLLVAIDWLGLAQRPTGVAQSALLALAALLAFSALREQNANEPLTLIPIVIMVPLFVVAAYLGAQQPVPIWPDALTSFHAPPNASAAGVWLAEQRAAGLLTREPVWALLRTLSLTGAALLAYAIYRRSTSDRTA